MVLDAIDANNYRGRSNVAMWVSGRFRCKCWRRLQCCSRTRLCNDAATGASNNVAMGYNALSGACGNNNTAVGHQCMKSSTSTYSTAMGYNALTGAGGDYACAFGMNAGAANTANSTIAFGYDAAWQQTPQVLETLQLVWMHIPLQTQRLITWQLVSRQWLHNTAGGTE